MVCGKRWKDKGIVIRHASRQSNRCHFFYRSALIKDLGNVISWTVSSIVCAARSRYGMGFHIQRVLSEHHDKPAQRMGRTLSMVSLGIE